MVKSMQVFKNKFSFLLLALLTTFSFLSAHEVLGAQTTAPSEKKTGGMMGDPASKRGVEYGFDKGFEAGKADKDAGLKPDPARHDDFNSPEKFYRYEFGSRAGFVQGFKSGFVGGYEKAFGKNVKITVPGTKSAVPGEEGSAGKPISKPIKGAPNSDAL